MVNLINLENVEKSYGLKTLLDGVSLGVSSGQRIGIVGLNGGGKSTLLKVMTKVEPADAGRVSHNNSLRWAMVTQDVLHECVTDPAKADMTIADAVLEPLGLEDYQWASDPTVREVLHGLGIIDLGLDSKISQLSGGQRRRTGLAAALVQDLDLLILDEPTNHLDVEGVQWLAEHVLSRNTSLLVVTHDRWFLDTVADQTWEVHDGQVDVYEGGYNDWTFARAERARQATAEEQRRQNLARKELAWLRRGAPARTSKPRYRVEAAEELIADVPPVRDKVELMRFSTRRQGKRVIELEHADIDTPDGRLLLKDLTWRLGPGERIGLVGVNGSGKTTLLRALAGDYLLKAGKRIEGLTVQLGWLRQELDDLDPERRLIDAVTDVASYVVIGEKEISASQLAERLGFSPKRQRTPIRNLSGGERRRLQLTRVLMSEPNVLLLDEPTNDLDIDTLQELESLLDSWPGTMVVISHDRYLVERVCDATYALFGDGKLADLPGGIAQYLEIREEQRSAEGAQTSQMDLGRQAGGATEDESDAGPSLSAQEMHELQKHLNSVELKLEKANKKVKDIEAKMATAAEELDHERLTELNEQLQEIQDERDELEMDWLESAERKEQGS